MKRFFEHINSPLQLFVIGTLCVSFTSVCVVAQDASEEPPAPSEEPVIEEEDDIVIPDEEEVTQEVDETEKPDTVEPAVDDEDEDTEVDVVQEEDPEPTAEELALIAAEQTRLMEQAMGQALLDSAKAAAVAGRWREAATKYIDANKYLPNNPEIIAGLQKSFSMLDEGPRLDAFQQRQAMEREASRALFDASMSEGHDRLQREDFSGARRSVEGAIARLDRNDKNLFSEAEYKRRRNQATSLLNQIAIDHEAWQHHRDQLAADEKSRDQANRISAEADKRMKLVNENLKRVRQLQSEQKYPEA
ncbi:MAG: hypothetical protein QF444_05100, partial [Phycisphaerales bacterium]|nr:hypothetical protein [Phycisphaerales bacterium]